MANHTIRFEGKVNATDLPSFTAAVAQMSDTQLSFYFAAFKTVFKPAHDILRAEMVRRVVETYNDLVLLQALGV